MCLVTQSQVSCWPPNLKFRTGGLGVLLVVGAMLPGVLVSALPVWPPLSSTWLTSLGLCFTLHPSLAQESTPILCSGDTLALPLWQTSRLFIQCLCPTATLFHSPHTEPDQRWCLGAGALCGGLPTSPWRAETRASVLSADLMQPLGTEREMEAAHPLALLPLSHFSSSLQPLTRK